MSRKCSTGPGLSLQPAQPALWLAVHLLQLIRYPVQVPLVNNTNVDRSVAIIHATVLACLRLLNQVQHLLSTCLPAAVVSCAALA